MQRDPLGYVDGMSLHQYLLSNPQSYTDVYGLAATFDHHGYPLHLGGAADQALFELSKEQHDAAHRYFRKQGFGFGPAGRASWEKLSSRQQKAHIMRSLRQAKVPNAIIRDNIDDILRGARPGAKIARGAKGRIIPVGTVGSAFLIVLTSTSTAHAGVIPSDWRGNATSGPDYLSGDIKCECECATAEYTLIAPHFWTIGQAVEKGRAQVIGEFTSYGNATATECHELEGGDVILEKDWQIGFTIYRIETTLCRFNGVEHGHPFGEEY